MNSISCLSIIYKDGRLAGCCSLSIHAANFGNLRASISKEEKEEGKQDSEGLTLISFL